MKIDYHVHSSFSSDSNYPMESVIQDAIDMGLEEICFTEHVDYGVKFDQNSHITVYQHGYACTNVDYPKYFEALDAYSQKYMGQIIIKKGLEFGIQSHTVDLYNDLFEKYPLDFVLLSIHQIDNLEFWIQEYQQGKTVLECYEGYYDEMFTVITNFKHYSCLAHMDLMRRYVSDTSDYFDKTQDKIDAILRHLIHHNKGIEVNTSSVRYEIDGTTPSINILKRYHELGGKIITIGSDSHKKEHLGFMIEESKAMLKEIGFKYYCTFDKMKPLFHEL